MTLTHSMAAFATLACIAAPSFASATFTTGSPGQFGSVAVYGTTANGMIGVCSMDILCWRDNDSSWQRSSVPCRR
jgi:hypothetical protein